MEDSEGERTVSSVGFFINPLYSGEVDASDNNGDCTFLSPPNSCGDASTPIDSIDLRGLRLIGGEILID